MSLPTRCRVLCLAAALAAACAGPAPAPPGPSPRPAATPGRSDTRAGTPPGRSVRDRVREQALQDAVNEQARLEGVAWAILSSATTFCPADALRPRLGLRAATAWDYAPAWRDAASAALGLRDSLTVLAVVPGSPAAQAHIRAGDWLVRAGDTLLTPGPDATGMLAGALGKLLARPDGSVPILYERGDTFFDATLHARRACTYAVQVVAGDAATAWSDGASVFVTQPLLRLTSDAELAAVLGDQLAHLLLGQVKARGQAAAPLADAPAQPALPPSAAERAPAIHAAGHAFSREQERAADSLALRLLAGAGLPPQAVPAFWGRLREGHVADALLAQHPVDDERMARLERALSALGSVAAPAAAAPTLALASPPPPAPAPAPRAQTPVRQAPAKSPEPPPPPPAVASAAPQLQPEQPAASPEVEALRGAVADTSRVSALTIDDTWLYPAPDIDSPPTSHLPRGVTVVVRSARGDWLEIESGTLHGYILAQDTRPVRQIR